MISKMMGTTKNIYKARGYIIVRETQGSRPSHWFVYRKLKNDKPSDFCFASDTLAKLSKGLQLFSENIHTEIVTDLAYTWDPEQEERPNAEDDSPQDDRPNSEG